ncbi:hypothetical protein MRB53_042343 [Persea americana]|nr:hypothetical protein MRB53_042343 [Persea americana]
MLPAIDMNVGKFDDLLSDYAEAVEQVNVARAGRRTLAGNIPTALVASPGELILQNVKELFPDITINVDKIQHSLCSYAQDVQYAILDDNEEALEEVTPELKESIEAIKNYRFHWANKRLWAPEVMDDLKNRHMENGGTVETMLEEFKGMQKQRKAETSQRHLDNNPDATARYRATQYEKRNKKRRLAKAAALFKLYGGHSMTLELAVWHCLNTLCKQCTGEINVAVFA